MCPKRSLCSLAILLSLTLAARAEDAYFRVPLTDLNITEGKLPEEAMSEEAREAATRNWPLAAAMRPYAIVDEKSEAFVHMTAPPFAGIAPVPNGSNEPGDAVYIRASKGADVTGLLVVPKPDYTGMVRLKFKVSARLGDDKHAKEFYQQEAQHYQSLLAEGVPGGAWFRHELRLADRELGKAPDATPPGAPNRVSGGTTNVEDTFDLFSGGRAVAENLQLDRVMPAATEQVATVELSSIKGITIAEIDWKKLVKEDVRPALDPLAAAIPADQHAIFFASFAKMLEVADQLDEQGTRLLSFADPRSEDARTRQRYERQLCLSTADLSRLLGPALVKSVAITGSDPYFISGTDVAVLFEAANPADLHALISARVAAAAHAHAAAMPADGKLEGTAYSGFRSPDRQICSYVARLGGVVVVTNSLAQLEQLVKAHEERTPTIASLAAYKFFRTRYPRGAPEESAFLFLSDATIRRWCSPR